MDESSAPGDLAALRGALVGTLGASKEARIGAELALEDWSAAPGYPVALLSVACAAARGDGAERAAAVAQAAAIAFKNYVDHSEWYERLPEEARRGVQEALLACLWSGAAAASPKLWLAALAAAAESDFPARWPHLPSALDDRLHGAWAADDIEGVVFALQCARVTIRACAAAPDADGALGARLMPSVLALAARCDTPGTAPVETAVIRVAAAAAGCVPAALLAAGPDAAPFVGWATGLLARPLPADAPEGLWLGKYYAMELCGALVRLAGEAPPSAAGASASGGGGGAGERSAGGISFSDHIAGSGGGGSGAGGGGHGVLMISGTSTADVAAGCRVLVGGHVGAIVEAACATLLRFGADYAGAGLLEATRAHTKCALSIMRFVREGLGVDEVYEGALRGRMPGLLGGAVLPLLAARRADEEAAAGDPEGWAGNLHADTGAFALRRPAAAATLRAGAMSLVYALARDRSAAGELLALLEWLRGVMEGASRGGEGDAGVLSAALLAFAAVAHAPSLGPDEGGAALLEMVAGAVRPAAAAGGGPPVLRAFACVAAGACLDVLSVLDRGAFEALVTALGERLSDGAEAVRRVAAAALVDGIGGRRVGAQAAALADAIAVFVMGLLEGDTANIQTSTAVQQTLYRFAEHLSDARSLQILIALRSWWLASLARRDAPPVSACLLTSMHAVAVHAVRSAGLRRAVAEAMNEVLGALLSDAWAGCAAARATPCAETTDVMETYFMTCRTMIDAESRAAGAAAAAAGAPDRGSAAATTAAAAATAVSPMWRHVPGLIAACAPVDDLSDLLLALLARLVLSHGAAFGAQHASVTASGDGVSMLAGLVATARAHAGNVGALTHSTGLRVLEVIVLSVTVPPLPDLVAQVAAFACELLFTTGSHAVRTGALLAACVLVGGPTTLAGGATHATGPDVDAALGAWLDALEAVTRPFDCAVCARALLAGWPVVAGGGVDVDTALHAVDVVSRLCEEVHLSDDCDNDDDEGDAEGGGAGGGCGDDGSGEEEDASPRGSGDVGAGGGVVGDGGSGSWRMGGGGGGGGGGAHRRGSGSRPPMRTVSPDSYAGSTAGLGATPQRRGGGASAAAASVEADHWAELDALEALNGPESIAAAFERVVLGWIDGSGVGPAAFKLVLGGAPALMRHIDDVLLAREVAAAGRDARGGEAMQ